MICKFFDFCFPLVFDRSGRNHQHPLDSFAAAQKLGRSQRLHGFSQTHVVRENHTAAARSEHGTSRLILQELGFQKAGRRILAAFELRQQFAFELQALGQLVFSIDVIQNIAIDDRLLIRVAERFQHLGELPVMLAVQPAASKNSAESDCSAGDGEAGMCNRTSIVSPY
jgi:hypothetical protein